MGREILQEKFQNDVVTPFVNQSWVDSETAHRMVQLGLSVVESSWIGRQALKELGCYGGERFTSERLRVIVGSGDKVLDLDNPIMVGAGWDKNAIAVLALYLSGFSGVEVGTIVPKPQKGNPRPRQFHLGNGVILNRLGFNSEGVINARENLRRYQGMGIPIGVSIGKNADIPNGKAVDDYVILTGYLSDFANYLAINVSSPNTKDLRALQGKSQLIDIVQGSKGMLEAKGASNVLLFVKIAPDLNQWQMDDVLQIVFDEGVDGVIATNTTSSDAIKAQYGVAGQMGGVSGKDETFTNMATHKVAYVRNAANEGEKDLIVVGVGGVRNARTARDKILAGADLVQMVSGIRSGGLIVPGKTNRDLVSFMDATGVSKISELRGQNVEEVLRWGW